MIIYVLGIVKQAEKILFLLRNNSKFFSGYYGLVGGKVDVGESVVSALIREVKEEIGIIIIPQDVVLAHCLSCNNERSVEFIALTFMINNWQGEIINCESDKHTELAWFSYETLPSNIIPRHRHIITMVQQGLLYSEDGWDKK